MSSRKTTKAPAEAKRQRRPERMNKADLKLLVHVLCLHELNGGNPVGFVSQGGMGRAAKRLHKAGLIVLRGDDAVPTKDGEVIGDMLVQTLQDCLDEVAEKA